MFHIQVLREKKICYEKLCDFFFEYEYKRDEPIKESVYLIAIEFGRGKKPPKFDDFFTLVSFFLENASNSRIHRKKYLHRKLHGRIFTFSSLQVVPDYHYLDDPRKKMQHSNLFILTDAIKISKIEFYLYAIEIFESESLDFRKLSVVQIWKNTPNNCRFCAEMNTEVGRWEKTLLSQRLQIVEKKKIVRVFETMHCTDTQSVRIFQVMISDQNVQQIACCTKPVIDFVCVYQGKKFLHLSVDSPFFEFRLELHLFERQNQFSFALHPVRT
jgi:hypothetical protein